LQGKLQHAAEKAAQGAIARQVNEAVREALGSIDDVRTRACARFKNFSHAVEAMRLSSKEESPGRSPRSGKNKWKSTAARRRRWRRGWRNKRRSCGTKLARSQEFVERMTREREPRIQARLNEAVTQAISQFETATSRSADRRYQLMLENTQAAMQEALLKLDVRSRKCKR